MLKKSSIVAVGSLLCLVAVSGNAGESDKPAIDNSAATSSTASTSKEIVVCDEPTYQTGSMLPKKRGCVKTTEEEIAREQEKAKQIRDERNRMNTPLNVGKGS